MTPKKHINTEVEKFVAENGKFLYHYSTIPSITNILTSRELWISRTNTMNDKEECLYFLKQLNTALRQELTEEALSRCEQFFVKVNNVMAENYPFAFCLSTLNDDAAQWERYADNANGACLVFNTTKLKYLSLKTLGLLNPVFYEFDIKKHYFYTALKQYFIDQNLPNGYGDESALIGNLCSTANLRKHYSFKGESEIRLINVYLDDSFAHIDYKNTNGTIKEVLVINLENWCKLCSFTIEDIIDSIIIGPRSIQSNYICDLQKYLKHIGYENLSNRVYSSECPLK